MKQKVLGLLFLSVFAFGSWLSVDAGRRRGRSHMQPPPRCLVGHGKFLPAVPDHHKNPFLVLTNISEWFDEYGAAYAESHESIDFGALLTELDKLIVAGCDINAPDAHGDALAHKAVMTDDVVLLAHVLEHSASFGVVNAREESLLHVAAARGSLKSLQFLLPKFSNVNIQDADGNTPLHTALLTGHLDCAFYIFARMHDNINRRIVNSDGQSVLDCVYACLATRTISVKLEWRTQRGRSYHCCRVVRPKQEDFVPFFDCDWQGFRDGNKKLWAFGGRAVRQDRDVPFALSMAWNGWIDLVYPEGDRDTAQLIAIMRGLGGDEVVFAQYLADHKCF